MCQTTYDWKVGCHLERGGGEKRMANDSSLSFRLLLLIRFRVTTYCGKWCENHASERSRNVPEAFLVA